MRGGMHVLRGVVGERQGADKPVGGEKVGWMQGVQEGGGKERKLCGHDQMEGSGGGLKEEGRQKFDTHKTKTTVILS